MKTQENSKRRKNNPCYTASSTIEEREKKNQKIVKDSKRSEIRKKGFKNPSQRRVTRMVKEKKKEIKGKRLTQQIEIGAFVELHHDNQTTSSQVYPKTKTP
jgi:hypothetical protein